jgi:hypothetical protein
MSAPKIVSPEVDRIPPSYQAASTRKVLLWRSGSRAELDTRLQQWRHNGWRVERRAPRVVEGTDYGALIVLRCVPLPASFTGPVPLAASKRLVQQREDLSVVPPPVKTDRSVHRAQWPSTERTAA